MGTKVNFSLFDFSIDLEGSFFPRIGFALPTLWLVLILFIKLGYQNKILQIFSINKQFHKKVAIFAHSTTTFNLGMKKGVKSQTRAQT